MVGSRGAVALHRPNGTDTPTRRWRGPAHRHQQIDGHVDNDVVFGGRITEPAVPLQTYPSELVLLVVLCGLGPFRHSVYSSARRFAAVPRCITVQPHLHQHASQSQSLIRPDIRIRLSLLRSIQRMTCLVAVLKPVVCAATDRSRYLCSSTVERVEAEVAAVPVPLSNALRKA